MHKPKSLRDKNGRLWLVSFSPPFNSCKNPQLFLEPQSASQVGVPTTTNWPTYSLNACAHAQALKKKVLWTPFCSSLTWLIQHVTVFNRKPKKSNSLRSSILVLKVVLQDPVLCASNCASEEKIAFRFPGSMLVPETWQILNLEAESGRAIEPLQGNTDKGPLRGLCGLCGLGGFGSWDGCGGGVVVFGARHYWRRCLDCFIQQPYWPVRSPSCQAIPNPARSCTSHPKRTQARPTSQTKRRALYALQLGVRLLKHPPTTSSLPLIPLTPKSARSPAAVSRE